MASRACGNKDEPLLVDTINEEPIGFDMAFAMSSIRSAQGMVACRLGKAFPSLERLEDHLEFCEIFTLTFDSPVVSLERSGES